MVSSIVNFCTNDVRFFRRCVEALAPISDQLIVPVCDHFFNGEKENYALLQTLYNDYPQVEFIEFAYSEEEVYGTPARLVPGSPDWATHWHNSARLIGSYFLKPSCTHVLFCDVDEIFDADALRNWLATFPYNHHKAVRFATYWYFLEARLRATETPDGPLLVAKDALTPSLLLNPDERMGICLALNGLREVKSCGVPIAHHYSWVRAKEELLLKTRTWGHHWERNWRALIEESPKGKDYVRGYTYEEVAPFFDPLQEPIPQSLPTMTLEEHRYRHYPNVKRIDIPTINRLELLLDIKQI